MLEVVLDHPPNAWVHVDFAHICWKLRCNNSTKHCSSRVIHLQSSPVHQHLKGSKVFQVPVEVLR
jgi:hypothetical protein